MAREPNPRDTAWAMSEDENLAVVRRTIEGFTKDVETWLDMPDPAIKWYPRRSIKPSCSVGMLPRGAANAGTRHFRRKPTASRSRN